MARRVQMVMIVPCEPHTQAVMQALDDERVRNWVVVPAVQCRRLGEIGYWPPVRERGYSVVFGMADAATANAVMERLRAAVHQKEICPDCLMYAWPSEEIALGDAAFDPVCRMAVDRRDALSTTFEGVTYYFCSEECRDRFLNSPTAFIAKAA